MAQIAFSAVSLEDLNKVHWTAKAAFVSSLIKGSLSVFYACLVQQNLSGLYSIEDVKSFFSKRALQEGFLFSKKKTLKSHSCAASTPEAVSPKMVDTMKK